MLAMFAFKGVIATKLYHNQNVREVYNPFEMHLRACQCHTKHREPETVGKLAPSPGGDMRWGLY